MARAKSRQLPLFRPAGGLVVDLFAGGGGASVGLEAALGRPVDIARFISLIDWSAIEDGCWEWRGYRQTRPDGSLSYGLFCVGKRKFLAHRMAYMLVHGWIPGSVVVRHRCDNVARVRPSHLLPGTQAQNLADMRERGRAYFRPFPSGTEHHSAKMDPDRVRLIRSLRRDGLSFAKIGDRVGLHAATVHDIVTGKTWRHVQ